MQLFSQAVNKYPSKFPVVSPEVLGKYCFVVWYNAEKSGASGLLGPQ